MLKGAADESYDRYTFVFFFKETAKMLSRVIVSFSNSDCPHPCQHLVLPLFLF